MATSGIIAGIAKAIAGEVPEGPNLIVGSLELFRELGDGYGTAVALLAIGEGVRSEGDEKEAETFYQEALGLLAEIGDTFWPGHLLQNLAHFRLHDGDPKAAAKLATEALSYGERYDYPIVVNLSVVAAGGVYLARGDALRCARILGAVQAQLKGLSAQFEPTDQADFERVIAAARDKLGDSDYESAVAQGAMAPWDDVLAVARACHVQGTA